MFNSVKTASWSLTPGITLQAVTKLGLFVMTKSRMLLPLVGLVTSWLRLRSSNRSTNRGIFLVKKEYFSASLGGGGVL